MINCGQILLSFHPLNNLDIKQSIINFPLTLVYIFIWLLITNYYYTGFMSTFKNVFIHKIFIKTFLYFKNITHTHNFTEIYKYNNLIDFFHIINFLKSQYVFYFFGLRFPYNSLCTLISLPLLTFRLTYIDNLVWITPMNPMHR